MKFSEILKSGFSITIKPDGVNNRGFSPSVFFYHADAKKYFVVNSGIIGGFAERSEWTDNTVNKHIENMIEDRFQIVITANEAHEKVHCLMKLLHHTKRSAET